MANFVANFMKTTREISNLKHNIGVMMGVFTALVILFSQVFYFDHATEVKAEIKTEQSDDSNDTSEDLIISQDAVSSFAQVNINQAFLHVISDIHFTIADQVNFEIIEIRGPSKLFKALFNLIISPNAP